MSKVGAGTGETNNTLYCSFCGKVNTKLES